MCSYRPCVCYAFKNFLAINSNSLNKCNEDSVRRINVSCVTSSRRRAVGAGGPHQHSAVGLLCSLSECLSFNAEVIEFHTGVDHNQWTDTGYRAFRCLPRQ